MKKWAITAATLAIVLGWGDHLGYCGDSAIVYSGIPSKCIRSTKGEKLKQEKETQKANEKYEAEQASQEQQETRRRERYEGSYLYIFPRQHLE